MKRIKITSVLIAAVIALSSVSAASALADNKEGRITEGGITFSSDKTIIYDCDEDMMLNSYTIPDTVTTIEYDAFSYANIRNLYIPETVTEVNNGAFFGWTADQTIYLMGNYDDDKKFTYGDSGEGFYHCHAAIVDHYAKDVPIEKFTGIYKNDIYRNISVKVGESRIISRYNSSFLNKSEPKVNNKEFVCYSSDKHIFGVHNRGYFSPEIVGISPGTAKLYWKNSNNDTIFTTTVTVPAPEPITLIKLNKSSVKLNKGKETVVKATKIGGSYNNGKIKWYTNSKTKMKVVNISKNTQTVRIKGLKKGSCYLVAKNSDNKVLKKIRVTVK